MQPPAILVRARHGMFVFLPSHQSLGHPLSWLKSQYACHIPPAADGYDIDYLRVPVTDEKAPKDSDFELLIQRLWCVPAGAALVFNCQVGLG